MGDSVLALCRCNARDLGDPGDPADQGQGAYREHDSAVGGGRQRERWSVFLVTGR